MPDKQDNHQKTTEPQPIALLERKVKGQLKGQASRSAFFPWPPRNRHVNTLTGGENAKGVRAQQYVRL
ncbi:MAG: hypothetical protein GY757_61665 [bacterium]|nr:hypothetical protein [bacterium]